MSKLVDVAKNRIAILKDLEVSFDLTDYEIRERIFAKAILLMEDALQYYHRANMTYVAEKALKSCEELFNDK